MSNSHAHGAFGAQLIGNRNLTPHTNEMGFTPAVDVTEDTAFQPLGDGKTFLQGLRGAAASSSGYAVNDYEFMMRQMRHLTGNLRDTELLTQAPFGFMPGNFLVMSWARKTTFNVPVSNSSTITTSINHQLDSRWWLGHSLLNPFGASAYSTGEVQTLTFNAADANQFFGLRAVGTAETFAFQAADTNSALKAGIEALAAYSGLTVTVTGSTTGTTTKTGTKTFTFSGTGNVPALEVVSGAVRQYLVSNGTTGNYKMDGGANFTLGATESDIQTNQRALAGAHANVVVKGTSTAPSNGTSLTTGGTPFGAMHDAASPSLLFNTSTSESPSAPALDPGQGAGYDFGTATTFDKVRVYFAQSGLYPANDFQIQTSTTGAFTGEELTVYDHSGAAPSDGWLDISLTSTSRRYVRIYNNSGGIFSLSEVQVLSGSVAGSANFISYFPVGISPTAPTATGTGATHTTLFAAGSVATTITQATTIAGGSTAAIWNLQTTTATGTAHDGGATTTTGFYGRLQVPLAAGTAFVALIEHSDSAGSGYTTLCTFASVTDPSNAALTSQEFIGAAGATVKRYVRARITTCTGSFAAFIGYARTS